MNLHALFHRHVLRTPIVAIVNALSSANLLAREFRKKGYRAINIQSTSEPLPIHGASFRPQDFIANIIHTGDLDSTVKRIRKYRPRILLAGFEEGVEFTDLLGEKLGLIGNGTALSQARRDKFLMSECVHNAGVRTIPQFKSSDLNQLLEWIQKNSSFPIIIKPPQSAGSDGVTRCENEDDVRRAFERLISRRNRLSTVNHELIAEAFVRGNEYIVNTVSYGGKSVLTDIWRSVKTPRNGRDFLYDYIQLEPGDNDLARMLFKYAERVLKALKIDYGAVHSEIMVDDRGPVLIEMGARLCGGNANHLMARDCIGLNQIDWVCKAYTSPDLFAEQAHRPYVLNKYARLIPLISERDGTIRSIPGLPRVKELSSFYGAFMGVREGDKLQQTIDLYTCPGDICLVHEDPAKLEQDYRKVREIEAEGFFDVN